jgi:hypothetical protein
LTILFSLFQLEVVQAAVLEELGLHQEDLGSEMIHSGVVEILVVVEAMVKTTTTETEVSFQLEAAVPVDMEKVITKEEGEAVAGLMHLNKVPSLPNDFSVVF